MLLEPGQKGDCPGRGHRNSLIERKPTGITVWTPKEMDFGQRKNVIISLTPGMLVEKPSCSFIHSLI